MARPTGLFPEVHVQDPVRVVFEAPVLADGGREPVPLRERAQDIAAFGAGVFPDEAGGLDPSDRLEPGPLRFG
ncbi:MAG TPA: hypothetical protein VES89_14245, partial [Candidatus Competibacteraceae bacterium]|nr:hypothetical protein [Candidatus Competibacteraceae bacterium]